MVNEFELKNLISKGANSHIYFLFGDDPYLVKTYSDKIAKEIGLKTVNELRQDENLNYIEGLDVIDFGLGSVLYDVNTKEYYTPNTGDVKGGTAEVSEDSDGNTSVKEEVEI